MTEMTLMLPPRWQFGYPLLEYGPGDLGRVHGLANQLILPFSATSLAKNNWCTLRPVFVETAVNSYSARPGPASR